MKMKNSITILYFMVILNYRPMRLKKYLQPYSVLICMVIYRQYRICGKIFWSRPGPGRIILLTVAYNFIILSFDNTLGCI